MNKKHFGKRALSLIMAMTMCITNMTLYGIDAKAEEEVNVNVSNAPYMDIVLTQTDDSVNTSTFKTDLKAKLKTLGIDTSNTDLIQISTIETHTEEVDESKVSEIFNTWGSYQASFTRSTSPVINSYSNTQASTYWTLSGDKLQNNTTSGGIDMFVSNDYHKSSKEDYTVRFGLNTNNSSIHGEAWYFFRLDSTKKNGYALVWDNHSACGPFNNADYKLYFVKMINGQVTILKTMTVDSWTNGAGKYWDANIKIENDLATITISGTNNGTLTTNYNVALSSLNTSLKDSDYTLAFGIFNFTGAYFSNITNTQETVKEYSDVLSEPNWRDEAFHFIVNVDNTTTMFTNGNTRASVLSRTMNDDIHFIDWGTSSTQSYANAFIKDNANKGKFTLSNNYNQAVADTANYIYSVVQKDADSEYVVVDEPTNINVTPASLKTNTATTTYPNGKWYIDHDYKFYENNTGLSAQTQNYKSDLICSFDKPGKYDIYFADKLVKTIYAHRLPVASFNIGLNGSAITLTSTSYDLDEQSKGTNGIKTEKWSYMLTDASGNGSWYDGKPTTFDSSKVYLIKLEVEDYQGATSYTTKYLGKGDPVAAFDVASVTSKYSTLDIKDTSYDPEGYTITGWNWVLKKNGTQVATYTTQKPNTNFNTSSLGVGTYQYVLTVTNSKGTSSETYTKTFTIIEDETKPQILANPTKCDWRTGTQSIEVKVSDSDSGLKNWQYAFTNSQTTPTSGWSATQTSGSATLTTPSASGEYYLHIKATDNAGNVLDRALGVYKIDNTIPTISKTKIAGDCTNVTINANDAHSGIFGYAITTTNVAPTEESDYQASNVLKTYQSGTYYVWVRDNVGQVSAPTSVTINRKQTATITWNDNNDKEGLRPEKVTLTLYRNGSKLKDVEIDGTTTTYTFDNLDTMDASGKAYTYTFGLTVNERYDVKVDGDNITCDMKQTTFSVTIPKTITLNGEDGKSTYKVKTSGDLYLNDTISVKPDTSFAMKDSTNYQTLNVNVAQSQTSFKKSTLGTINGTLQTSQKEFAGSWSGNFNFVIKLTKAN